MSKPFKFAKVARLDLSTPTSATLKPRVFRFTKRDDSAMKTAVRLAAVEDAIAEAAQAKPEPVVTRPRTDASQLSSLIDADFPFDESQIAAIEGVVNSPIRHACMTGAAGTGKTTCTKAIVERLKESVQEVDLQRYFANASPDEVADDEDYEIPTQYVPSVVMCGFTGRSTQMIKRNFPRDWHGNIMTIHRMLRYMPEYYDDLDAESGEIVKKRRFIPQYDATNQLPWDIIIIDEAGMVAVDLWENIRVACKPGTRIIMIGDINQLPPVHGRSVFGFAMSAWPSFELTHIHRQTGVNNSIVDNAWRILNGQRPLPDDPKTDPNWKFLMTKIDGMSTKASQQIRAFLPQLSKMNIYDPIRDTVVTPINGDKESTKGFQLGQIPLNRELAIIFNQTDERYIIDGGREVKRFAVGDKVMATKNDYQTGITNGMTGIITGIVPNAGYTKPTGKWGRVKDVEAFMKDEGIDEDDDEDISLEDVFADVKNLEEMDKKKEKEERGPASHIITVEFGEEGHKFEIAFATLAEVCSLQTAYVVTCHKMQGGESPTIIIICHQVHGQMLNREWLYTAITRASQRCILCYTDNGVSSALSKQRIKGKTLADKVKMFQELAKEGLMGPTVRVSLEIA